MMSQHYARLKRPPGRKLKKTERNDSTTWPGPSSVSCQHGPPYDKIKIQSLNHYAGSESSKEFQKHLPGQHPHKIEISNPGGFIGGVSADDILHHTPVARNPLLVEALTRLRLINRSNLGIPRMFTALLIEGKAPPLISDQGESVTLIFRAGEISSPFRMFVAEEAQKGCILSVDHLLILHYLRERSEIDVPTAARICQRRENVIREVLNNMERGLGYLTWSGADVKDCWRLRPEFYRRVGAPGDIEPNRFLDREGAKNRILNILEQRSEREKNGLSNAEIREITMASRDQVKRFMAELKDEGRVITKGKGGGAVWVYKHKNNSAE